MRAASIRDRTRGSTFTTLLRLRRKRVAAIAACGDLRIVLKGPATLVALARTEQVEKCARRHDLYVRVLAKGEEAAIAGDDMACPPLEGRSEVLVVVEAAFAEEALDEAASGEACHGRAERVVHDSADGRMLRRGS